VCPVAAGLDDDQFMAAIDLAEPGGIGVGRDVKSFLVD